jgi:hypothetical protein
VAGRQATNTSTALPRKRAQTRRVHARCRSGRWVPPLELRTVGVSGSRRAGAVVSRQGTLMVHGASCHGTHPTGHWTLDIGCSITLGRAAQIAAARRGQPSCCKRAAKATCATMPSLQRPLDGLPAPVVRPPPLCCPALCCTIACPWRPPESWGIDAANRGAAKELQQWATGQDWRRADDENLMRSPGI